MNDCRRLNCRRGLLNRRQAWRVMLTLLVIGGASSGSLGLGSLGLDSLGLDSLGLGNLGLGNLGLGSLRAAEPQRLTTDGRLKSDPVFLDGGERIVFTVQENYQQQSLMQWTRTDGKVERFRPAINRSHYAISFSADQRRYVYLENDGNLHVKLVIHDAERAVNLVEHNPGGGFAGVRYASMAPDASGVVYAFPERGVAQQIFWLSMDGQQRRTLTQSEGFDACPRYSPDGKRIAFASTRDGNFDIFVLDLTGGDVQRLTSHEGFDSRPAWSPDGRRLVYTSLRDGNYDLFVINADGSGQRRVTTHEERDDFGWWHPDGRRLVAVCERDGQHDLYLLDAGQ